MSRESHPYALHIAVLLLALSCSVDPVSRPVFVLSPGKEIAVTLLMLNNNQLGYEVKLDGKPVIEASPLGVTVDGTDLGSGISIGMAEKYQGNETHPMMGKHASAADHFEGARVPITHQATGTRYTFDVRVFDNGLAFRYLVPGDGERIVSQEATSFVVPSGSTVWYHGLASMHYEEQHREKDISAVDSGEWAGPPITIKLPNDGGYAAITESGIIRSAGENFPGMALQADGHRAFRAKLGHEHPENYPFILRYGKEYQARLQEPPVFHGAIEGPWRVILIGADLNALYNSDVIYDVAPAPDASLFPGGPDADWIKPGRAVWGYLTDEPRTLDGMKHLSRLAGTLGFEYHVVEGHWARWSDAEQKELVDYSNRYHVKLIFWKHSRDLRDSVSRREFFEHLHKLGVAGAKIDFFDHEAREIIDVYAACLQEAAKYHLVIDFHGANKPAGEARTWPNELAREAVYGMEFRGPWATHNTTLPFTRMLAGHADYTVLSFGERRCETSETHQIASAMVLQAPLLVFSEHPQKLLNHPAAELIKQIPAVWDETRVLPASEIGKVVAFARRRGEKWFLAVMNGEEARHITIDLSFLGEGDYDAMLVQDRKPVTAMTALIRRRKVIGMQDGVAISSPTVSNNESLYIELIPGGGFAAVFTPAVAGR